MYFSYIAEVLTLFEVMFENISEDKNSLKTYVVSLA